MATFSKRRNGDGSTSWDAMVRVVGYPATGKSFRSKLAAELWAARTEAAAGMGWSRQSVVQYLCTVVWPRHGAADSYAGAALVATFFCQVFLGAVRLPHFQRPL